jgi:nitroreductase
MSTSADFIPYPHQSISEEEMVERSKDFYAFMNQRRSLRMFSDRDVPFEVIEHIVKTAGTAPSGAHKQPWTFCIIRSATLKAKIRQAAEEEEYKSYHGRMSETWLKDLEPFGTDWQKPFLEAVPWIIVVFKRPY